MKHIEDSVITESSCILISNRHVITYSIIQDAINKLEARIDYSFCDVFLTKKHVEDLICELIEEVSPTQSRINLLNIEASQQQLIKLINKSRSTISIHNRRVYYNSDQSHSMFIPSRMVLSLSEGEITDISL